MSAPEGVSALTSALIVKDAQATIDSYEKALGAEVLGVMNCPKTGKVIHASLSLGGSSLFISDEYPEMGLTATGNQQFYLYVDNADSGFDQAKSAGLQPVQEPEDMFWGDRVGALTDANGNTWKLAQKVREVSPEEMEEAVKQMASAA